MKISIPSLPSIHRFRRTAGASCALATLLLLLVKSSGVAENPWTAPLPAWPSSESTGGTFSDPFPAHHFFHTAPPSAAIRNPEIDPVMLKAGSIAEHRVQSHSTLCWRYVKQALVAAGGVNSYPQTTFAKDAGRDLVEHHGFVQLSVRYATEAPVGSVLVYGGPGAGHVELRTDRGFVSDFYCSHASHLPFIGAFTLLDKHHKDMQTAQIGGAVVAGL